MSKKTTTPKKPSLAGKTQKDVDAATLNRSGTQTKRMGASKVNRANVQTGRSTTSKRKRAKRLVPMRGKEQARQLDSSAALSGEKRFVDLLSPVPFLPDLNRAHLSVPATISGKATIGKLRDHIRALNNLIVDRHEFIDALIASAQTLHSDRGDLRREVESLKREVFRAAIERVKGIKTTVEHARKSGHDTLAFNIETAEFLVERAENHFIHFSLDCRVADSSVLTHGEAAKPEDKQPHEI